MSIAAIVLGWCLITFGVAWQTGAWVPVWSVSIGVLLIVGFGLPAFVREVREAREKAILSDTPMVRPPLPPGRKSP